MLSPPLKPSIYSALGYVQTLTGDLTNAVENFHKALGIRREDAFSTNMLTQVIEQLMNSVAPFPGFHDTTPRFPSLLIPPKSPLRKGQQKYLVTSQAKDPDIYCQAHVQIQI